MPAMASGQSTGERTFRTNPRPQISRPSRPTITPIARPVSENQTVRACFAVGGGKSISWKSVSGPVDACSQIGLCLLHWINQRQSRTGDLVSEPCFGLRPRCDRPCRRLLSEAFEPEPQLLERQVYNWRGIECQQL